MGVVQVAPRRVPQQPWGLHAYGLYMDCAMGCNICYIYYTIYVQVKRWVGGSPSGSPCFAIRNDHLKSPPSALWLRSFQLLQLRLVDIQVIEFVA